jgi:hypothetical protein
VVRLRVSASSATLLLIVVGTVLRLVAASAVGLGVSESYYFSAARHLSLSYFDQPPAAAWLASIALELFGNASGLVVRLPFVLLFAGTTWMMFLVGRRLFSPWAGFFGALMLTLAPVFSLSVGVFFQPDGPLVFFWLAALYCLARPLASDADVPAGHVAWLPAGAMLGMALLSKYSAVFLVVGAGVWLLADQHRRRWLLQPGPYVALIAAALICAPVFIWNANHEWISFRWQAARGMAYQGVHLSWLLENLAGQLVEMSPWIWALLLLEPFRAGGGPQAQSRRFLLCIGLPPIVVFSAVATYADVGNHFHWGTPGYLTLLVGLGATVERWYRDRPRRTAAAVVVLATASISVMTLVSVQAATGRFSEGYGVVSSALADGNDPTIETLDYDVLLTEFTARGLLDEPGLFVFSDRYHVAGKVDYGLKGRLPFMVFGSDPRAYAFFESPSDWVGHPGILVSHRGSLAEIQNEYGAYCAGITPLEPVRVGRRSVPEVTLHLYRCALLTRPYPLPYP